MEAQVSFVLKQAGNGTAVGELCRKAGISQATFFKLAQAPRGLLPSEMKWLRQLEEFAAAMVLAQNIRARRS